VDVSLPGSRGNRSAIRSAVGRRGALEVLAVVGLYLISELSRGLAGGGEIAAQQHAAAVVRAERHLHVFVEATVQRAARDIAGLETLLGYAYLSLHLVVTAAVLIWVYRRHPHAYARLRNTLVIANALAVVGYALFPTAPPRLAGVGIADTVSAATSVNLTSRFVSSFYNPYAAVPSMHIGFALLVGITAWRLARNRVVRAAALAYPVFVLFVIVATGNHFFLDAIAGAAVVVTAGVLSGLLSRRRRSETAEIRPLPVSAVSEIQQRHAA